MPNPNRAREIRGRSAVILFLVWFIPAGSIPADSCVVLLCRTAPTQILCIVRRVMRRPGFGDLEHRRVEFISTAFGCGAAL